MSDEIISALISSFGAVVCCLLGIKIGKENSLKGMSKEVLQQQLDMVYSPIVQSWYQNPHQEIKDRLAFIQKIFSENFDLIMPSLFQQLMNLKSCKDISEEEFAVFERAINSNYNWNKKLLGYPYKKSAIYSIDLPTHGKYQDFIDVISAIAPSIGLVSLIFATTPLYNRALYEMIKDSSYPYFLIISFYFLIYIAAKLVEHHRLAKEKRKQKNNSSQK